MKIATVFLVAVTVFTSLFLETSGAPNDYESNDNNEYSSPFLESSVGPYDYTPVTNEYVCYVVEKRIRFSVAALVVLKDSITNMYAACKTDEERNNMGPAYKYVIYFIPFVLRIHEGLIKDVELNDPSNRVATIVGLSIAIQQTIDNLAYLFRLPKMPQEVLDVLDKEIRGIIVADGHAVARAMTRSLPVNSSKYTPREPTGKSSPNYQPQYNEYSSRKGNDD